MEVTEFAISPNAYTARVKEPLTLQVVNPGVLEHTLTINDSSGEETASLTVKPREKGYSPSSLSAAGEWAIVCTIPGHKMAGMTASLTLNP